MGQERRLRDREMWAQAGGHVMVEQPVRAPTLVWYLYRLFDIHYIHIISYNN